MERADRRVSGVAERRHLGAGREAEMGLQLLVPACTCQDHCQCKETGEKCNPECPCTGKPFFFGVQAEKIHKDRPRHYLNGKEVARGEVLHALTLADDRKKPFVTFIGEGREKPLAEFLKTPEVQQCRVQSYPADAWEVSRVGFKVDGKPTIYIQSPSGEVLCRFDARSRPRQIGTGSAQGPARLRSCQGPQRPRVEHRSDELEEHPHVRVDARWFRAPSVPPTQKGILNMESTILSLALPLAAFLLGHFHVLLPAPAPKAPDFPSTFGHGELVRDLLQQLANLSGSGPATPLAPANAATPPVDLQQVIQQLLAMLEKSLTPPAPSPKP